MYFHASAHRPLLSDRGPEFESELFSQVMQWMEIDKIRTMTYKPSTNGIVERFHRTLNSMLGKVVSESQRDWDDKLTSVMAAYRASPHNSTGFTPNRLFLGRENRMPLDLVMGLLLQEAVGDTTVNDFVVDQREIAEAAYRTAREHLGVVAERKKKDYDARVRPNEFQLGSKVWYFYPRKYSRKSPKWQRCYTGPYEVVRILPPVNYVLRRTPKSKPFVVHADKLKKCYSQLHENEAAAADSTEVGTAHFEAGTGDNTGDRVHQRKRQVRPPRRFLD